jgi:hypothetical protein
MAVCVPPEELVGYGTLLQFKNNLTDAWTTVAGTKDLEFPNDTTEAIETTDNQSGGYRTYVPNPLAELEEVTYEMKFLWSQWSVLQQMKRTKVVSEWRLVLMNAEQTYMSFCAFISGLGGAIPMEELVTASITLRPTGAPEWDTLN